MIDPYYRVKHDIHRKRPAYGFLCLAWMAFMAVIAGFFGYFSYNIEPNSPCFVKEGEFTPLAEVKLGEGVYDDIDDIAYQFDIVINMFFMQSVTAAFLSLFAVLSIFFFPYLLKYDHPLNILIVGDMVFGIICMFFLHLVRLGHGGKVCSGDYLADSNPGNAKGYLLERGWLLWFYIQAFWITMGVVFFILITIIVMVIKSLK